ncbi:hypothetical protein EVAR_53499_1 [Eumeta japonica]|uniref:Uncharacterized protein n=1 Tax=Eumeta variegata TaxID=151549 RepID=A0A4C1Y8T5_EUMVA|nr:hypothetical protein EVAR_53499_1 [Eumeta japonica]
MDPYDGSDKMIQFPVNTKTSKSANLIQCRGRAVAVPRRARRPLPVMSLRQILAALCRRRRGRGYVTHYFGRPAALAGPTEEHLCCHVKIETVRTQFKRQLVTNA